MNPGANGKLFERRQLLRMGGGIAAATTMGLGLPLSTGVAAAGGKDSILRPAPPAPPESPSIPARSVSVAEFGAVPDDGNDDTQAIQQAIDSLADAGGGTVYFESGRYDLSIQHPGRVALVLRSGVRLAARSAGTTTLRIADAQGDYYAILATFWWERHPTLPRNDRVHDIAVEGLVIDMNAPGNPIHETGRPFGPINHQRAAIWTNTVTRMSVTHCTFTDSYSIQVILINTPGISEDVQVQHCVFDKVGGSAVDYDHSSVYTSGHRALVAHNRFESRNGPGTNGARTAIEIHGDDQTAVHNTVKGYTNGFNAVGGYQFTSASRQLFQYNRFTDMLGGGTIWHKYFRNEPIEGPTLRDVVIDSNVLSMDVPAWMGTSVHKPRAGILTQPNDGGPIQGLRITNNVMNFGDVSPLAHDRSFIEDTLSAGVSFWSFNNPTFTISDFVVSGNIVVNAMSAGVWSNTPLSNGRIEKNIALNPGSNGTFDPPKDYASWGYPAYTDDVRTAVHLDAATDDVTVRGNITRCSGPQCYW